ncbi:MAG: insulinase family protein, partial [Bacteroidota bacterium]
KIDYPLPDNTVPLIGTAKDNEATSTQVRVSFKHDAVKDEEKTLGYMRLQLVRSFINTMMGQRLSELTRTPNPPFIFAYSFYGRFTRTKDAYSTIAQAANNESIKALNALLTETERMKLFGFTKGEYERAKADILRGYESRFLDRDKRKNRELVYPIIAYFLTNNPNPGIEFDYPFVKSEIQGITLDEINREAKKYVRDDNEVITVTGPDKPGITLPVETDIKAVIAAVKSTEILAYADNLEGKKLLDNEPVPGKVVKETTNTAFGTTEWIMSNGLRVIFKPTDIKEDELLIRGYSEGGVCQVPDEQVEAAGFLGDVVSQMGVGNFSRTDLNKMMAGKRVSVGIYLSDDQDVITGRTSPQDLETALQLIYLGFTQPRWNESDYKTWMEKVKANYINAASEPRNAFSDSIDVMMTNHHSRGLPTTYKSLDQITFDKLRTLYTERFSDPGAFTFQFVGKINPAEVRSLFEKFLASLPSISRQESYKDQGIRPPKGKVKNDFKRENKTPRTSVFVDYNGNCGYSANDRLLGAALRHILELRYIQSIREDEGGTYSVR